MKREQRLVDDDDPITRIHQQLTGLLEAYRAGRSITDLDPDRYKSYLRPRLLNYPDPDAAKLMSFLDERFELA